MRKNISAAIIVQDEEDYIERAILNVKDYVDEIIIIDGGSTDKTIAICESHECKVYHRQFDCHFANQRNYALTKCTNDWVLTLDADEFYSAEALNALPTLIKSNNIGLYKFNMVSEIQYPDRLETVDTTKAARLVKKSAGKWVNRIHEVFLIDSGLEVQELSSIYSMHNRKTFNRQLYNNLLYKNIESGILERPAYDLGLKGVGSIDYNGEYKIISNTRNGLISINNIK